MRNNLKRFGFLGGMLFCSVVLAESTSDQLTRIEAETLVLKAREKQLDVQANILTRQNEITAKQRMSDMMPYTVVIGDPVIRSVEGIGKAIYATLQLDNGNVIDVQVGDELPNGLKIMSIQPNEVIVQRSNRQRARLAAAQTQTTTAGNAGSGLNTPSLPMGTPRGFSP